MRNLCAVRDRLLCAIPDEEARERIALATSHIAHSATFAAPELQPHLWRLFCWTLNDEMAPYRDEPWFAETVRIVNDLVWRAGLLGLWVGKEWVSDAEEFTGRTPSLP